MAADGYPNSYSKGHVISGIDTANNENVKVFHAGTASNNGHTVTSGGRVLCVTAISDSVRQAAEAAYAGCEKIHWDGAFYRRDIGYRAINREQ